MSELDLGVLPYLQAAATNARSGLMLVRGGDRYFFVPIPMEEVVVTINRTIENIGALKRESQD